ncbi:muts domain V-domain-containing protein [Coemansia spiralis]|nr:muts domain V-domain-containing protein [Coemansia spiralis]
MVLTEGRGIASEIAYSFVDLTTCQCILSQMADTASYSRSIYAIVTTRPQLILVPKAMADGRSKAMVNIRRYLPWLAISSLERSLFNDNEGARRLKELAIPAQVPQLARIMHRKQYAVAAFNAMVQYLELSLGQVFASGSVNIKYKQTEGTMQIDPGAWRDLGLDACVMTNRKTEPTLFSAINHTFTKMGSRLLRANILQPYTDLNTIYARQNAVLEILDNEEEFFFLSTNLPATPDIDATITSIVRQPLAPANAKQTNQAINNVLLVKHILLTAETLATTFKKGTRSRLLEEIIATLADSPRGIFDKVTQEAVELVERYANDMQIPIRAVYKPASGYIMTIKKEFLGNTTPDDFVNVSVKKNLVTFTTLDMASITTFNRLLSTIISIFAKAIHGLIDVIRSNISVIYRISEAVALLDMLTSFACHCTLHSCVVPEFSDSINIVEGRHPILDTMGTEVVPNSIKTGKQTFTIVSGPNTGGKSTYLRQIVYLVIMAQIGCLVPANMATLKIFDKLFVRMNNDDNIAASESTFLREMHDISYILQNYDQHSLVAVDELGRSTNTMEGKAICRAICEEFLESNTTVFLTTHFLDLPQVLGEHPNCKAIVLSQEVNVKTIVQKYKAFPGFQANTLYGIHLAERMGYPQDIINIAKQVADEVSVCKQNINIISNHCDHIY